MVPLRQIRHSFREIQNSLTETIKISVQSNTTALECWKLVKCGTDWLNEKRAHDGQGAYALLPVTSQEVSVSWLKQARIFQILFSVAICLLIYTGVFDLCWIAMLNFMYTHMHFWQLDNTFNLMDGIIFFHFTFIIIHILCGP